MHQIYLDHAATTALEKQVLEAMVPHFQATYGNPSSIHRLGREARSALERARATVAGAIGAEPGEVFFTSGGTESDNLALRGMALAARSSGKTHLVTTRAEHHAVLDTAEQLSREGWDATILGVDGCGQLNLEELTASLGPGTFLVTVMHGNNETGTIAPLREIVHAAHGAGVSVHTDAVQTVGKIPVDVRELGVDALSLSAHKLNGPKGIGALYLRKGIALEPLLYGGGQERGRRPGTESVALAAGFAAAVELACARRTEEALRLQSLRDALEERIRREFPEVIVNGDPGARLPHILNISFDSTRLPLEPDTLIPGMDLKGIAVTSGSACTSGSMQPSSVLRAMGLDDATARASIRFSFGRGNSALELDPVLAALVEVVATARRP